jgi:hypothetical protein
VNAWIELDGTHDLGPGPRMDQDDVQERYAYSSGLDLNENVNVTKFLGNDCFALTFTSDTNKVKNRYFRGTDRTVYIDPINYSMKGYRTNGVMSGYTVTSGNVEVNGINIPLCRMLFNPDNSIFSVDMLSFPE